jgi:hypothetical protein
MKTVYETIMKMRSVGGKLEKLAILKAAAAKDTKGELKEFLRLTYEPKINFYQSKIASSGTAIMGATMNKMALEQIVATLCGRQKTGSAAKVWLADGHASFKNDWERELLTMMIERDVKAGFGANTVNKVWPGLITDIPYMRCLSGEWELTCDDGISRTIAQIVEEQSESSVLSLAAAVGPTGIFREYRQPINFYRNGVTDQDWFTITYEDDDGDIKTSPPITKNHEVFLANGHTTKTVGELQVGDLLF